MRIFDSGIEIGDTSNFGQYQLSYRSGDIVSLRVDATEPITAELVDFRAAIRTGDEPVSDREVALDVIRIVEAAESLASPSPASSCRSRSPPPRWAPPSSASTIAASVGGGSWRLGGSRRPVRCRLGGVAEPRGDRRRGEGEPAGGTPRRRRCGRARCPRRDESPTSCSEAHRVAPQARRRRLREPRPRRTSRTPPMAASAGRYGTMRACDATTSAPSRSKASRPCYRRARDRRARSGPSPSPASGQLAGLASRWRQRSIAPATAFQRTRAGLRPPPSRHRRRRGHHRAAPRSSPRGRS